LQAHFTLSNLGAVYEASDVFDGAVEEVDEEGEGGEEVVTQACKRQDVADSRL